MLPLNFLILNLAPPFGSVILIQSDLVACAPASVPGTPFHCGTEVCGSIATTGLLYFAPVNSPVANASPVPSTIVIPPLPLVLSSNKCNLLSMFTAVIPGMLAMLIAVTVASKSPPPVTGEPFICIVIPLVVGLLTVPSAVGIEPVHACDPTSLHAPELSFLNNSLDVFVATIA